MNSHYKILIFDIDSGLLKKVRQELKLSRLSVEVRVIQRNSDIIQNIREYDPDLVLSLFLFPSSDGLEILQSLRKIYSNMPFIFITNLMTEKLTQNFLKAGIDDLIHLTNLDLLSDSIEYTIRKNRINRNQGRKSNKLKKSFDELRERLSRHHVASEEELYQIARHLHEELGQELGALKIDISMFGRKVFTKDLERESLYEDFNQILQNIDKITQKVKKMSSGLRPEILDELGLVEAIKWLITQFEKNHDIKFESYLPEHLDGDRIFPITLYRIIQGALTNIVNHTDATKAKIELKLIKDIILLRISINGNEVQQEEFNINNIEIRERVGILDGKFEVASRKPVGKIISARIPAERQYSFSR